MLVGASVHRQGKHLASFVRTVAPALLVFLAALPGPASAEVLALDCGDKGSHVLSVWVDLDRSFVTVQDARGPDSPLHTYVAHITESTIKWRWSDGGQTSSALIDRRTGAFYERLREAGGGAEVGGPLQCAKSAMTPPAAKF
ncbi:MAG TPA: hypothetical protein VEE84_04680 [Burkholderiaceae bacterium]|nr:hypothetical protein [Burkholderiaceae bacterium]